MKSISKAARTTAQLRGAARLAIDAVTGITNIVEAMHRNIGRVSPIVGTVPAGKTRGITGLVYRSVRGVTMVVGEGMDKIVAPLLGPVLHKMVPVLSKQSPKREAVLAALNGVFGDTLDATANPLAIPMCLRQGGVALTLEQAALAQRFPDASGHVLVVVHGLCMNDLQWTQTSENGPAHDHGTTLAHRLGATPLYLHYNTGRPISTNGHALAETLEALIATWPVPLDTLTLLCHSMGGLVARSACEVARTQRHTWTAKLKQLVFLGTPHHGAPLERVGSWVDRILAISPYTAPLARLALSRSAGIQDLRYGHVLERDWANGQRSKSPSVLPLPKGVRCYAVAASKQKAAKAGKPSGDGLVPVKSAFGEHDDPSLHLAFPASRKLLVYDCNHFALLSDQRVSTQLDKWLKKRAR